MDLSSEEIRVLGCLVEKHLTTPNQYPLTLNALVLACNQTSNRDPVLSYDVATVEAAVTKAKVSGLARFMHPSHGRSVLRYRHELGEALGLDDGQLALLAMLMLRGPQTPGELRGRTERMASFASIEEVEAELDALARREEPLVARIERAPGQKEQRFAQLLGGSDPQPPSGREPTYQPGHSDVTGAGDLASQLEELRQQVAALRTELGDLRSQLGDG